MPSFNAATRDRAGHVWFWFALFICLVFCGEGLGSAASLLVGGQPQRWPAWGAFAGVAVLVGGVGAVLLNWLLLDRHRQLVAEMPELRKQAVAGQECQLQLAGRAEQQRRLRHDLRGALSPALLMADRLLTHADPAVKRAGEIMVKSVDRAASLLADPAESASPPADP